MGAKPMSETARKCVRGFSSLWPLRHGLNVH